MTGDYDQRVTNGTVANQVIDLIEWNKTLADSLIARVIKRRFFDLLDCFR